MKKMIINTGQRTDIPAFYSEWFINRIKEGYVLVRNPYYPNLVTKFLLNKDVVDCIGFCTKNPRPMFKYLDLIKDFGQIWHITITIYDRDIEPNVPPLDEVIKDFKYLSNKIGKDKVCFRYTPIIINEKYTVNKHIEMFNYIAKELSGYTDTAIFGFIDLYQKLVNNHKDLYDTTDENKIIIAKEFKRIADTYNLHLRLCSKEKWLYQYGIDTNGCMRVEDYEKAIGFNLDIKEKMEARKNYCSCYLSNDIGQYNSCMHLCKYCYANGKYETILANYKKHNPKSPLLIGELKDTDTIKEAKQVSYKDYRLRLF